MLPGVWGGHCRPMGQPIGGSTPMTAVKSCLQAPPPLLFEVVLLTVTRTLPQVYYAQLPLLSHSVNCVIQSSPASCCGRTITRPCLSKLTICQFPAGTMLCLQLCCCAPSPLSLTPVWETPSAITLGQRLPILSW